MRHASGPARNVEADNVFVLISSRETLIQAESAAPATVRSAISLECIVHAFCKTRGNPRRLDLTAPRGNANALNRSARDSTQTLEKARRDNPPLAPSIAEQAAITTWDEVEPDPIVATGPDETRPVPEEAQDAPAVQSSAVPGACVSAEHRRNRLHWADAMKAEAVRLQACAADVSAAQQKANTLWVEVLTGVASDLSQGKCAGTATPGMSKAALLRTTLMAGDPDFPAHLSNGIQRSGAAVRKRTQQTKRV